jgi:hypothetical protein
MMLLIIGEKPARQPLRQQRNPQLPESIATRDYPVHGKTNGLGKFQKFGAYLPGHIYRQVPKLACGDTGDPQAALRCVLPFGQPLPSGVHQSQRTGHAHPKNKGVPHHGHSPQSLLKDQRNIKDQEKGDRQG